MKRLERKRSTRRIADVEIGGVVGEVAKKEEGKDGRSRLIRTPRRRLRRKLSDTEKVVVVVAEPVVVEEKEEEEEEEEEEATTLVSKVFI